MNRLIGNVCGRIFQIRTTKQFTGPLLASSRNYSQSNDELVTEDEIKAILKERFPSSEKIMVEDVSGGCGAMFNIYIETRDFKGLSIPKQHRSVYDSLKKQIKNIHGLHVETKIPP